MWGDSKKKFGIAAGVLLFSIVIFLIFDTLFFVSHKPHRSLMTEYADMRRSGPVDGEQVVSVFGQNRTEKKKSDPTGIPEDKGSSIIAFPPQVEYAYRSEETNAKEESIKSSLFVNQRTRESFDAHSNIGGLTVIHSFTEIGREGVTAHKAYFKFAPQVSVEERITRPLADVSANRNSYLHGYDYYFDLKLCVALMSNLQYFFEAGTQRSIQPPSDKIVKRLELKGSSNFDAMVFFTLDNNRSYPLTDAYLSDILRSKPYHPATLADVK